MNISWTGKQEFLHPKQQKNLDSKIAKISKLLDGGGKGEKKAHIILAQNKNQFRAEITAGPSCHESSRLQKNKPPIHHASAAIAADAGMVMIHAITMLPATAQRTAAEPLVVPTPMITPVMVCVVETGTP